MTLGPTDRPREVVIPVLVARWTAYSQLPEHERAAIDEHRILPVPETCQLLADYLSGHLCEQCGGALHARSVESGYRRCTTCRRQPLEAA